MGLVRCLKCQVFMEESEAVCPDCGFSMEAPSAPPPARSKGSSTPGIPDFVTREHWDAAAPPRRRFERTWSGMLFFLLIGAGCIYGAYRFWGPPPAEEPSRGNLGRRQLNRSESEANEPAKGEISITPAAEPQRPKGPGASVPGSRGDDSAPLEAETTVDRPPPEARAPSARSASSPWRLFGARDQERGVHLAPGRAVPDADMLPAPRSREWTLTGHVVDLVTLAPVAGADLTFTDAVRDRVFTTTSFPDGRYRVNLPADAAQGYVATVSREAYADRWTSLSLADAASMDQASRVAMARKLLAVFETAPPLRPDGERRKLDILLIPKTVQSSGE